MRRGRRVAAHANVVPSTSAMLREPSARPIVAAIVSPMPVRL